MSAIGNCPWCGCPPEVGVDTFRFMVVCRACGARGPDALEHVLAIAAWNRLATPGQGEVRVRWKMKGNTDAYIGRFYVGCIEPLVDGTWAISIAASTEYEPAHPTEAAARAALEAAVREAIKDE